MESADDNEQLVIGWSDVATAPDAIVQFLASKCSRSCNEQTCPCIPNGLCCTELCKLQTCDKGAQDDSLLKLSEDATSDDEAKEDGHEHVKKTDIVHKQSNQVACL